MKRILPALGVLWLLGGAPLTVFAQSSELKSAYRQYQALSAQGKYAEAEPFARRALELGEAEFGPNNKIYATLLNNLGGLYWARRRYGEAAQLYKRSLAIEEKALGPAHPSVATTLKNLAEVHKALGRNEEAETLLKRSLAIRRAALGPDHLLVATALGTLASLYTDLGRYADAEPLYKKSLAILEKALGSDHSSVSTTLNNLAELYLKQGRYADAELLFKKSLAIDEKTFGVDHSSVSTTLNNLAVLYKTMGRYADAEPIYKRALVIREKVLGPDHIDVAQSLNNLAQMYHVQGRYADALPLYQRSLAVMEAALGPEHPNVGAIISNLAGLYRKQGRFFEAESLYKRSLLIREKALGPFHPDVAKSLNNLALFWGGQGRYAEAEPLYQRALAIDEKTFGSDSPRLSTVLGNLSVLRMRLGQYSQAASLNERSLAINEKALGSKHPDVALSLNNLAALYRVQGRNDLALEYIRRASAIHRERAARTGGGKSAGSSSEQRNARPVFLRHLLATIEMPTDDLSARSALTEEGFEAGQLANSTSAGAAVANMGVRFATRADALTGLVRDRQDAMERWRELDEALVKTVSGLPRKRDQAGEARMRREMSALDETITEIGNKLSAAFPEYHELTAPKPVPLAEAQALLAKDEALLTYLVWDKASFVFVVRRDQALAKGIALGAKELGDAVAALRKGLDPSSVESLKDIPPFNTTTAFELYQKLFQPVEHMLEGARHVFAVPDGALQSLPLGVLVTKESQGDFTDFSGYRQTAWLARKYAMTTLPSVSSLRALRTFAKRSRTTRPFLGVGDPQLEGETGSGRGVKLASLFTARGIADVESVRQLGTLPETAGELQSLARALGVGDEALILGTEATETRIKEMALSDYKVLAFATHGLVAGDLEGLSEPALVLTPPAQGSERDDGLLTASEVAQLKLDADWVILSACNTAAPDGTPGAEGLSGLAKAFFFAGSRALLVSHWPVFSDATVEITTRMLAETRKPGVGRSVALRRAMLVVMNDEARPHFAHPLFWAPFVVVGEGGRTT